jgi:ABC-type Fe3+ transport system substrate-binding protein
VTVRPIVRLALIALVVSSCGTAAAGRLAPTTRQSAQLTAIIAAATAELELTLSWAPGFLDVGQEPRQLADGFNKQYGLKLGVTTKPGLPMGDSAARAIDEFKRGVKSSTDVVLGTEAEMSDMARAGALVSEPWQTWAKNVDNLKLVAAGGVAVQVQTRVYGITYNSAKLAGSSVPTTMADLLKPQYRGRIATTTSTALFERLALAEVWGASKTEDYVRQFAGQIGGFINCGEEDRLVKGDFDIFAYDCGSARTNQMKAKGTLIGWSQPTDAGLLGYLYMGVPKNAAHPNAAKLFINYMLSREAQDTMYQFEFADHHLIPGSRSFAEVDKATKAGAKYYELTFEVVQADENSGGRPVGPLLQSIIRDAPAAKK